MRTVAEVGETVMLTGGWAITLTKNVFDTAPSGVFPTTGTADFGAGAFPAAESCVDETKVVDSGAPSKETTEPDVKHAPLTVSVKLPTLTGDGLTAEMLGKGRIVTDELPLA